MAVIELVREPLSAKKATVKEAEAATKRAAKQAESAKAAEATKKAEDAEAQDAAEEPQTPSDDAAGLAVHRRSRGARRRAGRRGRRWLRSRFGRPNEDGSRRPGFDIKGNADSMKFHEPDGQWYDQTVAEVYFATAEDAEKAGFTKAGGGTTASRPPAPLNSEHPGTRDVPGWLAVGRAVDSRLPQDVVTSLGTRQPGPRGPTIRLPARIDRRAVLREAGAPCRGGGARPAVTVVASGHATQAAAYPGRRPRRRSGYACHAPPRVRSATAVLLEAFGRTRTRRDRPRRHVRGRPDPAGRPGANTRLAGLAHRPDAGRPGHQGRAGPGSR